MQVSIPYRRADEEHTERVVVRRAPDDRQVKILSFPRHAHGVSTGDIVRVERAGDGAVATQVVARSPLITVHLDGPPSLSPTLRRHLTPLVGVTGASQQLAPGRLAVAVASHLLPALIEQACAATPDAGRDDRRHRAGRWRWTVTSRPTAPVPQDLPASADPAVATPWAPTDDISRSWHPRMVAALRDRADVDPDVREALRTGRYLAAVVPLLRQALAATYGPQRAHAATFPLGTADPDVAHRTWQAAHGADGRVRWAPDRQVDRDLRRMIRALGLDPDADPRHPCPATLPVAADTTSTDRAAVPGGTA